jgi:hypothetical protein
LLRLLTALAIEQNDAWRSKRWLVEPTFIAPPFPMRHTAQVPEHPEKHTASCT